MEADGLRSSSVAALSRPGEPGNLLRPPPIAVFTITDPGVHDADPGVHDDPIRPFTMIRSGRSRWAEIRSRRRGPDPASLEFNAGLMIEALPGMMLNLGGGVGVAGSAPQMGGNIGFGFDL